MAMDSREFKSFPIGIKAINNRVVAQVYSVMGVVDMYRDRVMNGAFKKTIKERKDRIQALWQHDFRAPPVAVLHDIAEIEVDELPDDIKRKFPEATGGLLGVTEYLPTDRGDEILVGIQVGAIKENSIGFDAIQQKYVEEELSSDVTIKIRELLEIRLWDLSSVNWGANPATFNFRVAVPFKATGTTDGDWSKPTLGSFTSEDWSELSDGEKRRITNHFAWASEIPPEAFGGLKLPHHSPKKSGIGPAHWGGVKAAMSRLMQAATQIDDKEGVYGHLSKHYKERDEEPPDMKLINLAYAVADAVMLDQEDLYGCFEALDELNRKLKEAEPRSVGEVAQVRTHFALLQARTRALMLNAEIQ